MPRIFTFLFLIFISFQLHAQTWELGVSAGGSGYMGDLNPRNPLKISGPSVGAFVKRNFNQYLSAKINYNYGRINGADSTSANQQYRDRNLSFSTRLDELSLIFELNFMKYIPSVSQSRYTPFIYLGAGLVTYNPQATYMGTTYDLRPLTTEGESKPYSKTAYSIPYGIGVKYNIGGKWNFIADLGYRNPNTNYLDDVSGLYPDKSKLGSSITQALSDRSGERTGVYIGTPGTQRGDLRTHDTYLFLNFTISFTFVTPKCYFEE